MVLSSGFNLTILAGYQFPRESHASNLKPFLKMIPSLSGKEDCPSPPDFRVDGSFIGDSDETEDSSATVAGSDMMMTPCNVTWKMSKFSNR